MVQRIGGIPVHLSKTCCRVGTLYAPPVTWPHGFKFVWYMPVAPARDAKPTDLVPVERPRVAYRVRLPDPETQLDRYVLAVESADELVGVPGFALDT
jgi:hypothetical protein